MFASLLLSFSMFFSCSASSCVCSSFFLLRNFPVSLFPFTNGLSVLSFALSVEEVNLSIAVFLFLFLGLVVLRNLTQCWYFGVLSVNSISCIKDLKLGLVPVSGLPGGKSSSNCSNAFVS